MIGNRTDTVSKMHFTSLPSSTPDIPETTEHYSQAPGENSVQKIWVPLILLLIMVLGPY